MSRRHHHRRVPTAPARRHAPGTPPGTVVERPDASRASLRLFTYGPGTFAEHRLDSIDDVARWRAEAPALWLDVIGLGDARTFTEMGTIFGLHPLALEDVVNTHQRPKMEDYGDTVFVVLRMPVQTPGGLDLEQVSLFIGSDFLITIQERGGDCLEPVRERMRKASGRIRTGGACYLAYTVLDAIIDGYFPLVEEYGSRIEEIERQVLESTDPHVVDEMHGVRHDLHVLRRIVWPTREAVDRLARTDLAPVRPESRLFFRDAADHLFQLADSITALHEMGVSLMELHIAVTGNRMNEVMKMLTLIATIFMPLGFLAGLYGMNFDPSVSHWNMPELGWPYGYPMVLAVMAGVAGTMLSYFRRRGWWG